LKIELPNQSYKYITQNSQECSADTAFVATTQNEKYIEDAKKRGAHSIIKITDVAELFGLDRIKIIGITGTNGKTTTASAIYSFLLDLGYKAAMQGTRGFFMNDEVIEGKSLTTPSVLDTYRHIYQAVDAGCEFFIMEVSSHAIVQKRIEGINFELKILTNITQDHLDYHKTLEEYINIKNSFFQDDTMKLINKDDKNIKFKMKNVYAYAADNPATYKVSAYGLQNGIHVALQHFSNIVSFSSSMMGLFNVYNLTAAVASVNLLTKKPLQEICDKVEFFGGVAGRMEVVNQEPLVIIDFAHTPNAMEGVFNSFAGYDIITVFGAGGNRDRTKRPLMGNVAYNFSKEVIITADNPRNEDPDLIVDDILKGCKDNANIEVELNRKIAIFKAIEKSKNYSKPVVLILGKGDEQEQIIYDKKFLLNDKNIVQELFSISK
jgi:UDP-N-acetylmuramoyl-L-alanyl-D-glutamate--2,6-diaminopimelate ligase